MSAFEPCSVRYHLLSRENAEAAARAVPEGRAGTGEQFSAAALYSNLLSSLRLVAGDCSIPPATCLADEASG